MIKPKADEFEVDPLTDRMVSKASRELMIPMLTADRMHCLAPSDFREIFGHIRACLRDMEFELGRWDGSEYYYKTLNRMADLIRHTNEATKFVRDRAKQAARDRKVRAMPKWGVERKAVDSVAASSPSLDNESYIGNGNKIA